jgi:hypothetical protein
MRVARVEVVRDAPAGLFEYDFLGAGPPLAGERPVECTNPVLPREVRDLSWIGFVHPTGKRGAQGAGP